MNILFNGCIRLLYYKMVYSYKYYFFSIPAKKPLKTLKSLKKALKSLKKPIKP